MKISKLIFLLFIPLGIWAQDSLKIITYNIWDGFEHNPERRDRFVDFIREKEADIVMLDELVEFYGDSLQWLGERCGYPYTAILKEEWYPVGVMSKTPIEIKHKEWSSIDEIFEQKRGLWHGLLHVRTADIDLLVTHLSPFDYQYRLNEAKRICFYADSVGLKEYLVAGDLNSYSPYDAARLQGMKAWQEGSKKGDAKRPQWNNLTPEGMFDLTTQTYFLTHGLSDPVPLFITDPDKRVTHPTFYSRHKQPGDSSVTERQRRIDYILLSPDLMRRCVNAEIFYPEGISDHYPVMVTLSK